MKIKYTIEDIVNQDLCTGCGICVSESSATLKMEWDKFGFLKPAKIGKKINESAIKVCPFNPMPDDEVEDEDKLANIFLSNAKKANNRIGRFENTYVGYSNEHRETSSSGGLATYVFSKLLEHNIVDYIFIVKEINGTYEYQLFSDISTINQISKTRYIPVTLEKLFLQIDKIDGRIAVSGVACFIKSIRLKQYYNPELKGKIPFLIGIICGGLKSKFFTDYLVQKSGIVSTYSKQEYRIKDRESTATDYSFGAYDEKYNFHQVKMRSVGDMWGTGLYKSNACDFCSDVLTELADISLGDAWLDEYRNEGLGNSVIITRSIIADELIKNGILTNEISVKIVDENKIIQSQLGGFNHRQDAIGLRIKLRKLRGEIIPFIRKRVIKDISIPFAIVQLNRLIVRKKSLIEWQKKPNLNVFEKKMKLMMFSLKLTSLLYRKLKK
ncbi:Coenzyme F420 hydrogenase/dehydrogenase, beta subunit C-terminal domain [Flavobacterium sp. AJR]|uniref:Coenzyme F420 hydrogenase/dehydrogenase, beta subunit C-terminal domain n=1 Tax=Flavobacterium sp. AJR TaxID=1979369 RepID=UPI000B67A04D|nr:Coenzyme F420 hydrogenase/dehydrogenase, beta subunit C-terminal domain [Flavobacterium sp. AJR]OUL60059.1 hypothetical protein B8T70_22370 [Flavobacterium sp. AJR]